MKLTEAGQRLYQIVNFALGTLDEFRQGCINQPVELVIGAGESLIQWLLLPRLSLITSKHPRLHLTLQNLRTEEILKRLADGSVDFGVVSRLDAKGVLATAPLGRFDYGLFLPPGLPSISRKLKSPSAVLDNLPLAILSGSERIRQALEEEAQKQRLGLDMRLRLTSYPQLALALQTMKVAVIMPTMAAALPVESFRLVRLPFLDALSRQVLLAWNPKLAELRPAIAAYARVLATAFRRAAGQR